MKLKLIALLIAALALVLLYVMLGREAPSEQVVEALPQEPVATPDIQNTADLWQAPQLQANEYESEYGPLPKSLRDTRIPFDVRVDQQNHLIVESSLRRLFDYFFTLVGEEDIEQIIQRIEELLRRYLPEPASSEALAIFQEYVNVKEAEINLREQMAADYAASGQSGDLRERVRLLRDLRQSLMSPEVYEAFYGEEDRRAVYSLDRHSVMTDKSLSLEQRNAALRELDQQLPDSLRQEKEEEYLYEELQQKIMQGKENGLSEADIYQMRSEAYGAEAAERFAAADQRQAEWDQRVTIYRQERQAILESGLSDADRDAEIARLRDQHFVGPERMRIEVIDRMYDQEGRP